MALRSICVSFIVVAGLAGCGKSYQSLSDAELATLVMNEIASVNIEACTSAMLSGDDSACDAAKSKIEAIQEKVDFACGRDPSSITCKGKRDLDKFAAVLPALGAVARGDMSAMQQVSQ